MPFTEDILWGSGRRIGTTRLICKIETDQGIIGWGETISLIAAVPAVVADIVAPLAVGYEVSDVERFHRHVLGAGYYHHKRAAVMAIAALEMAMWDALGKQAGLPLHALWGGRWRNASSNSCAPSIPPMSSSRSNSTTWPATRRWSQPRPCRSRSMKAPIR